MLHLLFQLLIIYQIFKPCNCIDKNVSLEESNTNNTGIDEKESNKPIKPKPSYFYPTILLVYIILIVIILTIYFYISKRRTDIQQFLVLLLSGLSNVLAGILLFEVNKSKEFKQLDGLLILVQPLMGLKGNLEMTMASRMSTAMNVREDLITLNLIFKEIVLDICLVQSQATVVAFVTSILAIIGLFSESPQDFDSYNAIRICAISLLTANTACFVLGIIISLVIVITKKLEYDPDDFATPMAASLGDLGTLLILIFYVIVMLQISSRDQFPLFSLLSIGFLFLLEPALIFVSYQNRTTRKILIHGWTPIIAASVVSSFSGLIFTHTSSKYPKLAIFQALFNGFAGNCTALLASRVCTSLHRLGPIGTINDKFRTFITPYYMFSQKYNSNARTTIILLSIVVPSHLFYVLLTASVKEVNDFTLTTAFIVPYLSLALIQIAILLYITYSFVHILWRLGYDPNIYVIPILTAIADITGTVILFIIYRILDEFNDPNAIKPVVYH